MAEFHLLIRTPEKDIYEGNVSSFSFQSEEGWLQILAHHASFMTTMQFSPLRFESESESRAESFLGRNGIFYFDHKKNSAVLLCLFCEEQSEISYKTAEEYLSFLTSELGKGDLSDFQVTFLKGEKLAVEKQIKTMQ